MQLDCPLHGITFGKRQKLQSLSFLSKLALEKNRKEGY